MTVAASCSVSGFFSKKFRLLGLNFAYSAVPFSKTPNLPRFRFLKSAKKNGKTKSKKREGVNKEGREGE